MAEIDAKRERKQQKEITPKVAFRTFQRGRSGNPIVGERTGLNPVPPLKYRITRGFNPPSIKIRRIIFEIADGLFIILSRCR